MTSTADFFSRFAKAGKQDNSGPQRSAVGEAGGLSMDAAPMQVYGQNAWNIDKFQRDRAIKSPGNLQWKEALEAMSPFCRGFFLQCVKAGMTGEQVKAAIEKTAGLNPAIASELRQVFEKEAVGKLLGGGAKTIGTLFRRAPAVVRAAPDPRLVASTMRSMDAAGAEARALANASTLGLGNPAARMTHRVAPSRGVLGTGASPAGHVSPFSDLPPGYTPGANVQAMRSLDDVAEQFSAGQFSDLPAGYVAGGSPEPGGWWSRLFSGPLRQAIGPSGLAQSAFGGLTGYFGGESVGEGGGIPGALLGALALNPRMRSLARANPALQRYFVRPITTSMAGTGVGLVGDEVADAFGVDTGGRLTQLGTLGGLGAGFLPRSAGGGAGKQLREVGRGMMKFPWETAPKTTAGRIGKGLTTAGLATAAGTAMADARTERLLSDPKIQRALTVANNPLGIMDNLGEQLIPGFSQWSPQAKWAVMLSIPTLLGGMTGGAGLGGGLGLIALLPMVLQQLQQRGQAAAPADPDLETLQQLQSSGNLPPQVASAM